MRYCCICEKDILPEEEYFLTADGDKNIYCSIACLNDDCQFLKVKPSYIVKKAEGKV